MREGLYPQQPSQTHYLKLLSYFGLALSVSETMNLFAVDCQGWGHPGLPCPCPAPWGLPHPAHCLGPISAPQGSLQLPTALPCQAVGPAELSPPGGQRPGPGWPGPVPEETPQAQGRGCPRCPPSCPASGWEWDRPCPPGPANTLLPTRCWRSAHFLLLLICGRQRCMASLHLRARMTNCKENKVCH